MSRRPGVMGWLLMAPIALWLLFFVVAPTAILLAYSFSTRDELGEVQFFFTAENYRRIVERTDELDLDPGATSFLSQHVYLNILVRSLGYAGLTTLICVLAGYPVAWFIARTPGRWRSRLLILIMIPFWTSFLVRTYAWITILKDQGVLNALLQSLGIISDPLQLLYTPGAVIVGLVYTFLPFMILPIYASAEKLDEHLVEAALDLGATPWRAFIRVILPLTLPGLAAGALLVFVPALGMFAINDLLGGARLDMIGNVIQRQFGAARNAPFGAAMGVALLVLAGLGLIRKRMIAQGA
jgi:spermidine/putrescine transport system permease protein